MRNDRSVQLRTLRTDEEAARWLYELRSEDFKEHEAYLVWLQESPRHVEAFLRVAEADASLDRIDPEHSMEIEPSKDAAQAGNIVALGATDKPRRALPRAWTLAAGIAVVCTVATVWTVNRTDPARFTTAVGEQRAIALDDGSLLHMNTGTHVEVRYTKSERTIQLLAGEALFRVQRDPARPFRVRSGDATIEAVGTEFNVLRGPAGSTVSVVEGRVRVERADHVSPDAVLGAGEEVRIANGGEIVTQGRANLARISAWRQRRLVFMNETLGAIAAEFNRYNRAPQIEVEAAAADLRHYEAMSFNADDPESLLAVLERDPGLEVARQPDKVIIRRR